jgi:phosphopantetheinyl transferase
VQCEVLAPYGTPPVVSITHVRSAVIAAAGEPEATLGVDLANLGEIHSVDSLKMTLSAPELELLNGVPEQDQGGRIVQAWCAREAAAKAHGTGLQGEPRDWKINDFDPDSGRITVSYDNRAYDVRVWQKAHEVLAICTARRS